MVDLPKPVVVSLARAALPQVVVRFSWYSTAPGSDRIAVRSSSFSSHFFPNVFFYASKKNRTVSFVVETSTGFNTILWKIA